MTNSARGSAAVILLCLLAVSGGCARSAKTNHAGDSGPKATATTGSAPRSGGYGDLTNTYRKTEAGARDAVEKAKKAREAEKDAE